MKDYINKMNEIDLDIAHQTSFGMKVLCWFVVAAFVAGVFAYAYKGVGL